MIELLDKLGWYVFFLMSLFDTPHHRHPQETVGVCAWQPLWCRRHHRHLGLHGLEAQDMEEGDTPGTPKPPCATRILVMAAIGTMVFHGLSTSFMVFPSHCCIKTLAADITVFRCKVWTSSPSMDLFVILFWWWTTSNVYGSRPIIHIITYHI